MKVKIGNKYYDSKEQPIMVILSDKDKDNINNMFKNCCMYLTYPEDTNECKKEEIYNWMDFYEKYPEHELTIRNTNNETSS